MLRFSIGLLALTLVRLPHFGISESETSHEGGESDVDASEATTLEPEVAAEIETDVAPRDEESRGDEETAIARSMASDGAEQPSTESSHVEEPATTVTTTTTTTTIEEVVTTTTTTFAGQLPDISNFPDEIDDSFIYNLQQSEFQSLALAQVRNYQQGAWEYGDYRHIHVKYAVRCSEACEGDLKCYHWNFNLVTRKCELKTYHGGMDDSRLDWIIGHSSRYNTPDSDL